MALIRYTSLNGTIAFSKGEHGMSDTNKVFELHTIDIVAKSWLDSVNGNSYFATRVIINYGMGDLEQTFYLPLQYGYGGQYEAEAIALLKRKELIPDDIGPFSYNLKAKYGIIIRRIKVDRCLKREVVAWGKE